jgi:RNA polymerase sigma-70 factor (family 1)
LTSDKHLSMIEQQNVCEEPMFASLFRKWGAVLRNFLYYRCGNLDLAEDMMQDAFIKLWQECSKVSPDKARAFLYTVARNRSLDQIRHDKVALRFQQNQQNNEIASENPVQSLETNELKLRLENAIGSLPEGQRMVFLLNRMDELTYVEIADLLDLSVKAVEKRMHGALVRLREILRDT